MSSSLHLKRARTIKGSVRLPGSKSIANRSIIMAALSSGITRIYNLPPSDDIAVMLGAMPALGVKVEKGEGRHIFHGVGGPFPINRVELNLENAGTALRPMTAVLAACNGEFVVDGNEQMRRRPIRDLVEGIRGLGVDIQVGDTGCPPVTIRTTGIRGGVTRVSGKVSSQFLTALLLAAPLAREEDVIIEIEGDLVSKPYVDITLGMMMDFGVTVENNNYKSFRVPHNTGYQSPMDYRVEGDASSATYFLGAAALPGSGPVMVRGLGERSIQGDIRFIDLLKKMGAKVEFSENSITVEGVEPGRKLRALDVDMNVMPDAAMTLAVLALFADGETHIRNIENLRVKESERIRGLKNELEKLGASVIEESDALHITPPVELKPAVIETYKDHRMAMAFSLASFGTELDILDPGCVSKTYPGYFDDFLPLLEY